MYKLNNDEIIKGFLGLLKEFDAFCKRHNIRYFLAYGSMLGAVRNHGFIPWDNDIDIFMFRDDANRMIQNQEELNSTDFFIGIRKYYSNNVYSRIYFIDKTTIGEKEPFNLGLHIDGFILNDIPTNIFNKVKFYFYNYSLIGISINEKQTKNILKKNVIKLLKYIYKNKGSEYIGEKYLKLLNNPDINSKFIYIMRTPYGIKHYNKKIFSESILVDYEGLPYPIPKGYHEFLSQTYGDYMTPLPTDKRVKKLDVVYRLENGEKNNYLNEMKPITLEN